MRSRSRSRVAGSVRVSTGNALVRIVENRDAPKEEDIGAATERSTKAMGVPFQHQLYRPIASAAVEFERLSTNGPDRL